MNLEFIHSLDKHAKTWNPSSYTPLYLIITMQKKIDFTPYMNYFALVFSSHILKVLFSVSRHTTKYPVPGKAILRTTTFPPSLFTLST